VRRIFYDCEFIEDGHTIDLISIGMVDDQGGEFYAVNAEMPLERISKHDWLMDNVVPTLPVVNADARGIMDLNRRSTLVRPKWVIRNEVREFIAPTGDSHDLELWAYYGAYDHVVLCQLWGTGMDLPAGVPMFTHELMQLWTQAGRPDKPMRSDEHNALADARWDMDLWRVCTQRAPGLTDQDAAMEIRAAAGWPDEGPF
jgi:hypothetical protein